MNQPLYQQIINHITNTIINGDLSPGDKVPSEKELSDQFQVSRITSKKALDLLASNQIIERIRGKGSYVTGKLSNANETITLQIPALKNYDGMLIGAIFPDFMSGYGLRLQHSMEQKISEYDGTLIIKRSCGLISEEEKAITSLIELGVKGLIVFPVNSEQYNRKLLKLILEGFPVVVVDRDLKGIHASTVSTDNQTATRLLTTFLFEQGHEQIAFLSPPPERTSTVDDRLQGFQKAFLQYGLRLNPAHLLTDLKNYHLNDIVTNDYQNIRNFVMENPEITAFVAAEYELAIMLSKVLMDLNKSIPDEYSIVCFDCPDDLFDIPRYTHIRQDEAGMGAKAVELLMSQLQGENVPMLTLLDFQLVEGRSTRSVIRS